MSKQQAEALRQSAPLFCCPLCGEGLEPRDMSLLCRRGHCFDISKRGYVNFAPNAKASLYDAELFECRGRIFDASLYEPVVAAVDELVGERFGAEKITIVDAGCGEGYYSRKLTHFGRVVGVDLSRDAILCAARRGGAEGEESPLYAVGDLAHLPIKNGGADVVADVLSPANYPEFSRVLNERGILVKVVPSGDYLVELRRLYGLAEYTNSAVEELFARRFHLVQKRELHYTRQLTPALARDLARMTPLSAHKNTESGLLDSLTSVTIALNIWVGEKQTENR